MLVDMRPEFAAVMARAGVNPNGDLQASGTRANEQELMQYLW